MRKKNVERLRKSIWIVLMVTIFLVPLLVVLKVVPVPVSLQVIYNGESRSDLFAYAKAQILQIGAIISVIATGFYQLQVYKKGDWKKSRMVVLLLSLFAVSIIISFILSDQKQLAWAGMIDRYEGTLTWLCYVGLVYSIYVVIKNKKEVVGLIYAFVLSATLVSIIGVFQMFSMDFFKSKLGMMLMLGSRFQELFMDLQFKFEEGRVYTTLYNPNYVGSLIALAFPLTIYSVMASKKWWLKLIFALMIIPQLMALIGSKSTGGFVAVVVTVGLIIVFLLIKYPFHKLVYVVAISLGIVTYLALTQMTVFEPYYAKIMKSIDADPASYFTTEFADVKYHHPQIIYTLMDGSYVSIMPHETGIDIQSDADGELIEQDEQVIYKLTGENYLTQVIYQYNEGLIRVHTKNLETEKTSESRFNYYFTGHFSIGRTPLDMNNYRADSIEWFENERFMSGRGYIWNRTIPLVLERPVFGYGADTYAVNFPQGDLIYKYQMHYNHTTVVDKPHNLFLNMALNFGFFGLIIFLGISLYAGIRSRMHFLLVPVLSYFVVGLINDSVVFATYMLFVLFGLLLAMPNIENEKGV